MFCLQWATMHKFGSFCCHRASNPRVHVCCAEDPDYKDDPRARNMDSSTNCSELTTIKSEKFRAPIDNLLLMMPSPHLAFCMQVSSRIYTLVLFRPGAWFLAPRGYITERGHLVPFESLNQPLTS